ncbi:MAG: Cys-tRNA(Pro) deacylase [Methylobacteriaceae bacterium]|jgi:Cys-tRNA(Pro)/Cys-tRNA(Cys) deacylase|nr:Cys-tRNA(Pro) deacylase [Methylobacteriaceae bacterium]
MAGHTPATRALQKAGVDFTVLRYEYEPGTHHIGLHAAESVNESPARVLKTLMVEVDGKPACAVIPSDRELMMKRVAAAFSARDAAMMKPETAERLTGYHVGGISPFGQRKAVPVAFEEAAIGEPYVLINAGQRGLMVRLAPAAAITLLKAAVAPLTR